MTTTALTAAEIAALSYRDLKAACKARGLPSSGAAALLREALLATLPEPEPEPAEEVPDLIPGPPSLLADTRARFAGAPEKGVAFLFRALCRARPQARREDLQDEAERLYREG